MKGSQEIGGTPVVAGGDVAEMFELVEEAFDTVAQAVSQRVVRDDELARAQGGDDGVGSGGVDELAQGIAVVALWAMTPVVVRPPASRSAAAVLSWASPPVRMDRKRRPRASARVWILVINPFRERPIA